MNDDVVDPSFQRVGGNKATAAGNVKSGDEPPNGSPFEWVRGAGRAQSDNRASRHSRQRRDINVL